MWSERSGKKADRKHGSGEELMGISRNLFISIAFHFMLISAVIGAGSRGKAVIPTERLITVLLLSQPEERVMPEKNVSAPAPSQMPSPPVTSAPNPFPLPKKIPEIGRASCRERV